MLRVLTRWNKIKIKDTTDGFKPILEEARPPRYFPPVLPDDSLFSNPAERKRLTRLE